MLDENLVWHTTEELIEEIFSRPNFQGIIIRSKDEHKGDNWKGERTFRVTWNASLTDTEVELVVAAVAKDFKNANKEKE